MSMRDAGPASLLFVAAFADYQSPPRIENQSVSGIAVLAKDCQSSVPRQLHDAVEGGFGEVDIAFRIDCGTFREGDCGSDLGLRRGGRKDKKQQRK